GEPLALGDLARERLDAALALAAADRDAAERAEQAAERRAEDLLLAQPRDAELVLRGEREQVGEVPVRGVRRRDQHEARRARALAPRRPAPGAPEGPRESSPHPTPRPPARSAPAQP